MMRTLLFVFAILLVGCASEDTSNTATNDQDTVPTLPPEPEVVSIPIDPNFSSIEWERDKKVKKAESTLKLGNSTINFTANNAEFTTSGTFEFADGAWTMLEDEVTGGVMTIDLSSAMGLQADKETDKLSIQSPNYLNIEKYPTAKLEFAALSASCDSCDVTANLTIKDTTGAVTFPVMIEWKDNVPSSVEGTIELTGHEWNIINPDVKQEIERDKLSIYFRITTQAQE